MKKTLKRVIKYRIAKFIIKLFWALIVIILMSIAFIIKENIFNIRDFLF